MNQEYGKWTKKHLGQHFLADEAIVHAIISAIAPTDNPVSYTHLTQPTICSV